MKYLILLLLSVLIITSGYVAAAEWHTEEATSYLLDKDYQLNIIILYCSEKYEDENMFKQCVKNHATAYIDIYKSIEYLYTVDQDGFNISKPMKCLTYSLSKNWWPEVNSANWILVQKTASQCMNN